MENYLRGQAFEAEAKAEARPLRGQGQGQKSSKSHLFCLMHSSIITNHLLHQITKDMRVFITNTSPQMHHIKQRTPKLKHQTLLKCPMTAMTLHAGTGSVPQCLKYQSRRCLNVNA